MSTTAVKLQPELQAIQKAWKEHIDAENRRSAAEPHHYIYASSRRRCLRRMYYECTDPSIFPEFSTESKARLARGVNRERDISIDLMRVGRLCIPKFEFVGQQERIAIKDRKQRRVIRGKIDGFIRWESGAMWPAEIKSWSTFVTDRIKAFDDLFQNYWTWSGAFQLLAYLFEKNAPYGLLILDRPGLPLLIQVDLEAHLAQMEEFLRDAEMVVDACESGEVPDFSDDPHNCKRCPLFGNVCQPPLNYGPGASVLTDPSLLQDLERWYDLKPGAKEFRQLDESIKEKLRGVDSALAGAFVITGKWCKTTKHEIPEDILAKYQKVDPRGKFTLTITRTEERDVNYE